MATLHGKSYLMARELTFGGTTITVRNDHGFLCGTTQVFTPKLKPYRERQLTEVPDDISQIYSSSDQRDYDCRAGGVQQQQLPPHYGLTE